MTLFDVTIFSHISMSKSCVDALTAPLDCSQYILNEDMLYTWNGFSADNLLSLCTDACDKSIQSYRSAVIKFCSNDVYTDPAVDSTETVPGTNSQNDIYRGEDVFIKPIALADYYFLNYKLVCLKNDETKRFCYSETANGTNTTINECSSCNLGAMGLHVQDARNFEPELAAEYSSLVSSCSTTVAPIATPSRVFIEKSTTSGSQPNSNATCSGSSVPVPKNQTCDSFAFAHNVSTYGLLGANHLAGGCTDWPGDSSQLCIQGNCTPYVVKKNDTCSQVSNAHNITLSQLLRWNYFIDPYCKNWEQQVGHVICISDPSGYTPPKITIPSMGEGTVTTAAPVPSDAQPESNTKCGKWYEPLKDQSCAEIGTINAITFDDFRFLNPQINANCTNMWANTSYCIKAVGDISTYNNYSGTTLFTATATPQIINLDELPEATYTPIFLKAASTGYPFANESVQDCHETFNNDNGEVSCWIVAMAMGVTAEEWVSWNPSVLNGSDTYSQSNCTLKNETQYCGVAYSFDDVAPATTEYEPAPTSATTNATTECDEWYEVGKNETCEEILKQFNIPAWALFNWNPDVGSKCQKLMVGAAYCVEGPGWSTLSYGATPAAMPASSQSITVTDVKATSTPTKSAFSSSASTSSPRTTSNAPSRTSSGPPGPTQSGIVKSCTKWYLAKKDDNCQDIAENFKITLKQFYSWNPAVGNDCKNLWLEEAYCVLAPDA